MSMMNDSDFSLSKVDANRFVEMSFTMTETAEAFTIRHCSWWLGRYSEYAVVLTID